ncbi:MAG: hypothetical protein EPN91_06615 [Salinibacterium sp.]|nr:MAG: hypothetical protein EPN91_06615 [Salinibacterium sp.]
MTFPVPPDVRASRDFELVFGQDEILRNSTQLDDPTVSVAYGEWMKLAAGKAKKLEAGDVLAAPPNGAKVSWTLYKSGDSIGGQSDAVATKSVDLLSGTYQAKTKLYNTGSTYLQSGNLLVAVYDATLGGILDAPNPAAYTVLHLAAAIGRVISVDDGVLTYESPA